MTRTMITSITVLSSMALVAHTAYTASNTTTDLICLVPGGQAPCGTPPQTLIRDILRSSLANLDGDSAVEAVVLRACCGLEVWDIDLMPVPRQSIDLAEPVRELALGDVDGDGETDAIVASGDQRVSVFLNDGSPLSATPSDSVVMGVSPLALLAADLDGDGHSDVVACGTQRCAITWGGANGQLSPAVLLTRPPAAPGGASSIANSPGLLPRAANAFGHTDGRLDLAILDHGAERVDFYRHDPDRAFSHEVGIATGKGPTDLLFDDLDCDGAADAIIANHDDDSLTVVTRNIAGDLAEPFHSPVLVSTDPFSLGLHGGPCPQPPAFNLGPPLEVMVFQADNVHPFLAPAAALIQGTQCGAFTWPYGCGYLLVGYDAPERRAELITAINALMSPLFCGTPVFGVCNIPDCPIFGNPTTDVPIFTSVVGVTGALDELNVFLVAFNESAVGFEGPARDFILGLPGVDFVEPNYFVYASSHDPDPLFGQQWGLDEIAAPAAWDITSGSDDVVLAVLDSGVDTTRQDIEPTVRSNADEVAGDGVDNDMNLVIDDVRGANLEPEGFDCDDPRVWRFQAAPEDGHATHHGTAVSEVAASIRDNGDGIAGVARASIERIKVLDDANLAGTALWVAHGIVYAKRRGANIANLSLGGPNRSETVRRATAFADLNDIVVVASAGNCGNSAVQYPARHDDVVAVGAIDINRTVAAFSDRGLGLDLVAPGVKVIDAAGILHDGTSFAAPHVSGTAVLMKTVAPNASAAEIRSWLLAGAVDLLEPGRDDDSGHGLLQADDAVALALACAPAAPSSPRSANSCAVRSKGVAGDFAVRFRYDGDQVYVDGGGLPTLHIGQEVR